MGHLGVSHKAIVGCRAEALRRRLVLSDAFLCLCVLRGENRRVSWHVRLG